MLEFRYLGITMGNVREKRLCFSLINTFHFRPFSSPLEHKQPVLSVLFIGFHLFCDGDFQVVNGNSSSLITTS